VFAHGDVARQSILVHAAKGTQKIPNPSPQAFRRVDVNLTNAIAIIVARPFVLAMIHRDPLAVNLIIAIPFIRIGYGMG